MKPAITATTATTSLLVFLLCAPLALLRAPLLAAADQAALDGSDEHTRIWQKEISRMSAADLEAEIATLHAANTGRLRALENRVAPPAPSPSAPRIHADDSVLHSALAIARRYNARVATRGPDGKQGIYNIKVGDIEAVRWTLLQAREIANVLAAAEKHLDALADGRLAPYRQPALAGASLKITPDGFRAVTRTSGKTESTPVIPGGYGHFYNVVEDGEFLRETGTRLIQQERGPNAQFPNGAAAGAQQILDTLSRARATDGWFVDFLLSPHYMPKNLYAKHPDLANSGNSGFLGYNIDHPVARDVIEKWIRDVVPLAINAGRGGDAGSGDNSGGNESGAAARTDAAPTSLFAFCLSNEPGYSDSGRDPQSLPLWRQFLREKHQTLAALNAAHRARHASFDDVPVPPYSKYPDASDPAALAAFYDWTRFNNRHFADWHRWMGDLVKEAAATVTPPLPPPAIHVKIMPDVLDARPPAQRTHGGILSRGVDPELLTEFTDIAGCDSWSFVSPRDPDWHYTWLGTHLFYDLLHSFNNRPVFDSEMHVIVDRHPAEHIPATQTYTAHWQGALHHRTAWTTWKWGEPGGHTALGSIYLRPANLFAAAKATHDLNRLAAEVEALNAAPARVAILYSPTSLYWQSDYPVELRRLYTRLTLLGHKITFVSERQLAAGKEKIPPAVEVLFLPRATHTTPAARAALANLATSSANAATANAAATNAITIASIGDDNLRHDEYNRDFSDTATDTAASALAKIRPAAILTKKRIAEKPAGFETPAIRAADLDTLAAFLARNMRSPQPAALLDTVASARAYGIEYRDLRLTAPDGSQRRLLPLTNLSRKTLRVRLDLPPENSTAPITDLISGQPVDTRGGFDLHPLTPLLLEIRARDQISQPAKNQTNK
ncbi:MAG: hypothetical protein LBK99_17005 [Opitutaceae bacterium]|jgi:hypothetical protein|nr:hypothetical protein [Opitutaceae bacterium]